MVTIQALKELGEQMGLKGQGRLLENYEMWTEVLAWLSAWSEVQMICIWSSWCHHHPIISCTSKIQNGLPFWCWLPMVVLEKTPLNGCSSSSSSSSSTRCGQRRNKQREEQGKQYEKEGEEKQRQYQKKTARKTDWVRETRQPIALIILLIAKALC